jgi:hypothetical protein
VSLRPLFERTGPERIFRSLLRQLRHASKLISAWRII